MELPKDYNIREKIGFIIFLLFLLSLVFVAGVEYGVKKTSEKFFSLAADILDIELSEQAKQVLLNNPALMSYAIENYEEVVNPFDNKSEPEKLHYESCMLRTGDEKGCYNANIAKYGNFTI